METLRSSAFLGEWPALLPRIAPAALFTLVLLLYLTTLAPGVLGGDVGELQFVPSILSLAHPSGYPLQILLNRLWLELLPWGSVAARTNALSAVLAAAGAVLSYRLILQIGPPASWKETIVALAATLWLATGPAYWSQSVIGDKYALNGFLTALLFLAAYAFWSRPTHRRLMLLGLCAGLGLAHHRALAVYFPSLALLAWIRGRTLLRRPGTWLMAAAGFLAPLTLYLYIPWAARRELPPFFPSEITLSQALSYLFLAGGANQIMLAPHREGLLLYVEHLSSAFTPPAILAGALGLLWLWLRRPHMRGWLAVLGSAWFLAGYLAANYENFDLPRRYVYFTSSQVVFTILLGMGLRELINIAGRLGRQRGRQIMRRYGSALCALLILAGTLVGLPERWISAYEQHAQESPLGIWRQDLKSGGGADRLAAGLALVKPGSFIVGDWEQVTPLWYAQRIDGLCPDCIIVSDLNLLAHTADRAKAEGRELYVARTAFPTSDWSAPTAAGPLVHLARDPSLELPGHLEPLGIDYEGGISLVGLVWPLGRRAPEGGKVLPLTFIWRSGRDAPPSYAFAVRLVGPAGDVWQADHPAPVLGMYPFDQWRAGQVVGDYHEIPIPPGLPAGEYRLEVVLYLVSQQGEFITADSSHGPSPAVLTFLIMKS